MNILYTLLSVPAAWRITHLLSKEDGPFDIIFRLRKKAGEGFWGALLDCFYCISVWVSLLFGLWLGTGWGEKIVCWWALSGLTCLLEQGTTKTAKEKQNGVPEYKED